MFSKYREWIWVAVVLIVTFLAFSSVIRHDFVDWDDDVNVYENPNVQALNAQTIKDMFTSEVIGGYTPLTTLSFAMEHALFGMKPGVFHTTNLLLHLLVTLLVFIFIRRLGFSLLVAVVTALLFGVHPMRVESVAWITERKDVLYALFFLLSILSYLSYRAKGKSILYFFSLFAFVLSLLSKIQAVALPLVLLLVDYLLDKRLSSQKLMKLIPFFVLSLLTGVVGVVLLSQRGSLEVNTDMPFFQRIFIGTYSLFVYLYKVLVPHPLSAIYPMPEKLGWLFYVSAGVLVLMAWAVWKWARRYRATIFALLFFLFNVVFVLQVVGAGTAFLADRFTYVAYIGLFLLLALLIEKALGWRFKWLLAIPAIGWFLFLGFTTYNRVQVWKNSETLFSDVLETYPNTLIAQTNLGVYYRQAHRPEKAIEAYTRAISIQPEGYLAYSNRGEVYFEMGQFEKAFSDISRSLVLNPDNSQALSNRAAIFGMQKQYDLALADLTRAVVLDSSNLRAWSNLLLAHYTLKQYSEAVEAADAYLRLKPDDAVIINHRGLCLGYLDRDREALSDFNRAIELDPAKGTYYQNRSYQLSKMGKIKDALADILKAQELGVKVNPNYLEVLQSH